MSALNKEIWIDHGHSTRTPPPRARRDDTNTRCSTPRTIESSPDEAYETDEDKPDEVPTK